MSLFDINMYAQWESDTPDSTALNVYPTHRVVVVRGISMYGQLVMEVDTLTPVLLMATHLAFILLRLVQQTRGDDRLTMMKIVQQRWQSHSVTTLIHSQENIPHMTLTIRCTLPHSTTSVLMVSLGLVHLLLF